MVRARWSTLHRAVCSKGNGRTTKRRSAPLIESSSLNLDPFFFRFLSIPLLFLTMTIFCILFLISAVLQGWGRMEWADRQESYEGDWSADLPHGQGTYIWGYIAGLEQEEEGGTKALPHLQVAQKEEKPRIEEQEQRKEGRGVMMTACLAYSKLARELMISVFLFIFPLPVFSFSFHSCHSWSCFLSIVFFPSLLPLALSLLFGWLFLDFPLFLFSPTTAMWARLITVAVTVAVPFCTAAGPDMMENGTIMKR